MSGERKATVLLVDDQPIVAMAVGKALQGHADIAMHYCQDPTKALATAAQVRPTVILQDLVMPGVDGLDLVAEYRRTADTTDVPIIVLSSKEEATTKAEAFARGADDYIVKVPDPIELVARVRHHSRGYTALLERNEAFRALADSEARMAKELSQAAYYVRTLLDPPVDRPDVRTSWVFVPSASLGGDSFGHHWIDEHRFAVYIIDVCGHGVGPALLSVSAMNLVRSLAVGEAIDPTTVLMRLNAQFPMARHNGMFFTMWYGVLDVRDRSLTWAGAGHPPAILVRRGALQKLDSDGMMIGVVPEYDNTNVRTQLDAGDRLYLYSDGVYEIEKPTGGIWGLDAFCEALLAAPGDDRIEHLTKTTAAVAQHTGTESYGDDYSILEIAIR
jgi:sigma-B regulation protein RsbU (phosphoserine phosphatase)